LIGESVHGLLPLKLPLPLVAKVTVPRGAPLGVVLLTVAVQTVDWPTRTLLGVQLTVVVVAGSFVMSSVLAAIAASAKISAATIDIAAANSRRALMSPPLHGPPRRHVAPGRD
jgi:hypothetical protein